MANTKCRNKPLRLGDVAYLEAVRNGGIRLGPGKH